MPPDTSARPPLALSMGEPAGVSPEITGKAWAALRGEPRSTFVLIGDADYFHARMGGVSVRRIAHMSEAREVFPTALPVLHLPLANHPKAGTIDRTTAAQVIRAIDHAVDLCFSGAASGLVTNPINKDALYAAGFAYQGHTDYLASLASKRGHDVHEVMMLVAQDLRAIPVTIHISLADVPRTLTTDMIVRQARVVAKSLRKHFLIPDPRIAVSGLNPHAGENGAMGHEEQTIIQPALSILRAEGLNVVGPMPADTAFHREARNTYDAILCMYHDQALIPVKTIDFHGGVNVTLGLPFIRTSPDHGTALNIAGSGQANPSSLIAAIRLAARMAENAA